MQIATEVPFVSDRIRDCFEQAVTIFRVAAHDSKAANHAIQLLQESRSDQRYATGGRNDCVRRLAEDVESYLGMKATLLFRTPGALHDSLQTLMDAYEDAMDGIYYHA